MIHHAELPSSHEMRQKSGYYFGEESDKDSDENWSSRDAIVNWMGLTFAEMVGETLSWVLYTQILSTGMNIIKQQINHLLNAFQVA